MSPQPDRSILLFVALLVLCAAAPPPGAAQPRSPGRLAELSEAFQTLAAGVNPAVVQIFATGLTPRQDAMTSAALLTRQRVSGSGVVLHPDGYIVTNAHLVQGATEVQILIAAASPDGAPGKSILAAQSRTLGAQIVGIDRETDLAVLKVQARDLAALPLGDSDDLRPGQLVFAFGSPLGLDSSVTMGVVSAPARQLQPADPMIYVQTDAPINPGSSGGPLVDVQGRVVGINTFILSQSGGSEGLGFAAPSNIVRNVFEQIRKTGRVRRGEIGVRPQTITPQLAAALGFSRMWGVVLSDVYPGGPASQAGLAVGDVVLALDGKTMENGRQFQVNLYRRALGERVRLDVQRGAERLQIAVPVVERPDDPERFGDMVTPRENLVTELGVLALDLNAEIVAMLPALRTRTGVLVAATSIESPLYHGERLMPGDIIHTVNRTPVARLADLRTAFSGVRKGEPLALQVERRGELLYVVLELE